MPSIARPVVGAFALMTSLALARPPAARAVDNYPFPQHVTYAAGTIRPTVRTQAQQDDDVRAYYDQWKADYVVAAGPGQYRIKFARALPDSAVTVSEGQGFGMVVVPLMAGHDPAAQSLFDGLWAFARANPSTIDPRLMGFRVPPEDPAGTDSAFDGDCDMAYGLLLADKQWGSTGAVDYAAAAQALITAIRESTIGPDSHLPLLGDWTDPHGKRFNQYTPRSSDFMLDHFRAFGRATGDPTWGQVVGAVQDVIDSLQARAAGVDRKLGLPTGLLPDFIRIPTTSLVPRPAGGKFLESRFDGAYYYNAVRDPWRLGTDALLSGDARTLAQVRAMATWIAAKTAGDPQAITAGYRLNGRSLPKSDYFSIVFAAPFGVAAMTNATQQPFLNEVYSAISATHEDYYEDSVTLLGLLVMTGAYWDPTTTP